jgi:hypothetical protein
LGAARAPLAFTRDGYEIAYQQPCRNRDRNGSTGQDRRDLAVLPDFSAMSWDQNGPELLSGRERCEPRGDMQTSAADTKIAHENKACALREKP